MANRDGRLIARAGVILLALSFVNGFLIHAMTLQRQALSAHLVGLIGSSFLIGLSVLWPHLSQTRHASRAGAFFAMYGFVGGWLINFLAAATGHFGIFPIAMSRSVASGLADGMISAGLLSIAVSLIALCSLIFWGLRDGDSIA